MKKQNSTKRTMISLILVFSLSVVAWSVQNYSESASKGKVSLEASVYPKIHSILEK